MAPAMDAGGEWDPGFVHRRALLSRASETTARCPLAPASAHRPSLSVTGEKPGLREAVSGAR